MSDSEGRDALGTSFAFTEMASEDPAATRNFLERVFHWPFRSVRMPQGEYLSFDLPGGGAWGDPPDSAHRVALESQLHSRGRP